MVINPLGWDRSLYPALLFYYFYIKASCAQEKIPDIMLELSQNKVLMQNPKSKPVSLRLLFPTFPIRLISTK